jgi:propionyl-CoA carboxylase alpha chain
MHRLLIANRGEIAVRVIRTAHALGLGTVAVYSDPDDDAMHVRIADEAVRLPGAAAAGTYLRGDLIIAAARATGADAIHPGYGFLSENAAFAADVAAAGLTFVGPSPDVIAAMGAKLGAKELMEKAGVPVLPGGEVTDDTDLDELTAQVGLPLLVKASFGGGGRGMRLVRDRAELDGAVAAARREAAAAFGDGTVFAERYVTDPRHVEVQIVGDTHGTMVHLFERECSIQRRYQKVIEEAPSPAVDDDLRAALGAAAVAAGQAIGYVGAGTVEFVLDQAGRFYFLEVNTRLQVEHPVTELVTGLDLVEVQLRVAEGEPLGADVLKAQLTGHAIEARLYAEDATADFRPAVGTLHRFSIPAAAGVRADAGYADGSQVSPYYDAMLAKVIGYGRTRAEAAARLARALERTEVHGVITNRDLLAAILREPEFLAGGTDTGYLTRHRPAELAAPDPAVTAVHALAAALAGQAARRATAPVLATLPSGWRNVRSADQHAAYDAAGRRLTVSYRLDGPATIHANVDGEPLGDRITACAITPDGVDLDINGVRRRYAVHRVETADGAGGAEVYVDGGGASTAFAEVPRFPPPDTAGHAGSLVAPTPGMVVRVLAAEGDRVTAGQPLVVLEAMKMEHTVTAPVDGMVTWLPVAAGEQVATGQVIATVEDTAEDADDTAEEK